MLDVHSGTSVAVPEAVAVMCAVFAAGSGELLWGSKQLEEDSLRVVRERAVWELSKLVTPASGHLQGAAISTSFAFFAIIPVRKPCCLAAVEHCWIECHGIRDGAQEMCTC